MTYNMHTMAQTRSSVEDAGIWWSGFEWEIKGAGVEEVCGVTGDFLGPDKWAPKMVQRCELVEGEPQKPGCVRKVVLFPIASGEPFTYSLEKLVSMDPLCHSYTYTILEGTMPGFSLMDHYVSTFKLSPLEGHADNGTLLHWSYECRPVSSLSQEQASTIAFSLYQAGVDALKERFSLPNDCVTLISKS